MIPSVRRGQRPSASRENLIARTLNEIVYSMGDVATRLGAGGAGNAVLAVNVSTQEFRFGDVAAIDATPFADPMEALKRGVCLKLRVPTSADFGNWVVCAQKIPVNQAGYVWDRGLVLVRIQALGSDGPEYAFADIDPAEGSAGTTHVLLPQAGGNARILQRGEVTVESAAEQWAAIRFGECLAYPRLYQATSDEDTETQTQTVQALNQDGSLVGEDLTVSALQDGTGS